MTAIFRSHLFILISVYVGALYAATFGNHQAHVIEAALMAFPLVWISISDLGSHIIPDTASLLLLALGLFIQLNTDPERVWLVLSVAALLLAVLWLAGEIFWRIRGLEALGIGDAKLIAAGAVCVGPVAIWSAVFLACIGGIIVALLTRKSSDNLDRGVPFGPFLAYGLYLTVLSGVGH